MHVSFATCLIPLLSFLLVGAEETVEEAARLARSLVDGEPHAVGVIGTNYPPDHPTLANQPFALQEYYGSCFQNGSLALLMFPISQSTKNIFNSFSSNAHATITVQSEPPAASAPRLALMGTVRQIETGLFESEGIEECFLNAHPDASSWIPSKWGPHAAFWARFDPHAIYYVGGFGGLHFIGYIPLALYQALGTKPEVFPSDNTNTNTEFTFRTQK